MTSTKSLDINNIISLSTKMSENKESALGVADKPRREGRLSTPENWYAEPFTKRTACKTPGQCGDDCDCGCAYNTLTELERLPLIEEIAQIFPNEWLAFVISAAEDDDLEPTHGKLIAHSPNSDDVYDAVNTVLWNQHVYVYFNGNFDDMKDSYGNTWDQADNEVEQRTFSGPKQISEVAAALSQPDPLPNDLLGLIYSAIDHLYNRPNLNEAIRRLRLARVRAAKAEEGSLISILDATLKQLETALPRINEVAWFLEEALTELETADESNVN